MSKLDIHTLRQNRLSRAFDLADAVEMVVVVAMPARSGSSWLIETLKQSSGAVHFKGELTPLLRLYDIATPNQTGSEALTADDAASIDKKFMLELSLETGWPTNVVSDHKTFIEDTLFRLHQQWPDADLVQDKTASIIRNSLTTLMSTHLDDIAFTRQLISNLAAEGFQVDENFYDFGVEPRKYPNQLPWTRLYESPPFIKFGGWRQASPADFKGRPLIIKSAGDIHRLSFYKQLFRNAEFKVIHLARNPAATINGLIDGWRSAKYQSFKVGNLNIDGYSNLSEAWRGEWWKFDLAPGWEAYRKAPLVNVCAWQWESSQTTIFDWIDKYKPDTFLLRYEDLIIGNEKTHKIMYDMCQWLSIDECVETSAKIVNASRPPSPFRWKSRSNQILPLIQMTPIRKLTERLGYKDEVETWP